jgi:hypothetical protein
LHSNNKFLNYINLADVVMKSNLLDKEVHELLTINFERDFWDGLTDDPLGNID